MLSVNSVFSVVRTDRGPRKLTTELTETTEVGCGCCRGADGCSQLRRYSRQGAKSAKWDWMPACAAMTEARLGIATLVFSAT